MVVKLGLRVFYCSFLLKFYFRNHYVLLFSHGTPFSLELVKDFLSCVCPTWGYFLFRSRFTYDLFCYTPSSQTPLVRVPVTLRFDIVCLLSVTIRGSWVFYMVTTWQILPKKKFLYTHSFCFYLCFLCTSDVVFATRLFELLLICTDY